MRGFVPSFYFRWFMSTKLEIWNAALIRCGAEPVASLVEENKRSVMLRNQYNITLRDLLNDTTWNFATSREVVLTREGTPSFGFGSYYTYPSNVIRILEVNKPCEFRIEEDRIATNYDDLAVSASITSAGALATVIQAEHGYNSDEVIYIKGADQAEYNGKKTITVVDANTYTYAITGAPASPATGTILATRDSAVFRAKALLFVDDPTMYTASFVKVFVLKLAEDISYGLVQSAALQNSIISEAERYLRRARSYNSQEGSPADRYPTDYTWGERL